MTEVIKKDRNYGIDLLRIVAMFLVVVLHCLGQGGVLNTVVLNSPQYKFTWFLEICAYCAVDVFALISGYVSYTDKEKKTNWANYIITWLQVVFYGIFVTIIFNIYFPQLISSKDYLKAILPVSNKLYWYFTAYTGLFVLMPFLNKGIRACENITMKKTFIIILLFFSIYDTITNVSNLINGYSFIWIVLLYILGATIKKCEIGKKIKNYQIILGILSFYGITYIYKVYGNGLMNLQITNFLKISYTSPLVLGTAILYVIGFSRMKFKSYYEKIISFGATSAFSIYLLNNHYLVWDYIMKNLFVNISNKSTIEIFICITGFSIAFVIGSIFIDKIRILLFKICNVKLLAKHIEELLKKFISKLSSLV